MENDIFGQMKHTFYLLLEMYELLNFGDSIIRNNKKRKIGND